MNACCVPALSDALLGRGVGAGLLDRRVLNSRQTVGLFQGPQSCQPRLLPVRVHQSWALPALSKCRSTSLAQTHKLSWGNSVSDVQTLCKTDSTHKRPEPSHLSHRSVRCGQAGGRSQRKPGFRSAAPSETKPQQGFWSALARAAGKAVLIFVAAAAVYSVFGGAPAHALSLAGVKDRAAGRWQEFVHTSWPWVVKCCAELREHGVMLASLLAASAFFSLAETSITTLWPWKVRKGLKCIL